MAEYSSGAIYFTGLGSDIDFDSIIEAEVNAASYKKDQLETWSAAWQEKIDALQELNSALLDLRTALKAMDSSAEFVTKTADSSDTAVATAVADGDAEAGSHKLVVKQLAQNDVWVNTSTGFSSTSDSVTASDASFTYSYAGKSYTIDVAAGTSLSSLASLITNNSGSKGDVKAITINDGDAYYLEIYGMEQGAGNTVSIVSSTLSGFAPGDFANTQAAQSAQFKVDGYPPASNAWISRDSNTVDDVVEGLTLTLRDTGETRFTVTLDTDALQEKIEAFVDAVNTVRALIDSYTSVTSSDDDVEASVLTGNYGVNLVEAKIKDIIASAGLGFVAYNANSGLGDTYSTLSQIGIQTDTDTSSDTYGLLVIDYEALYEALDRDPEGVASLFVADYEGETDSSDFSYVSSVEGVTEPGKHEVSYVISGGALVSATIDGKAAEIVDGWQITAAPGTDAQGLTLYVDNHADGTYGGAATVKQGKVKELVDVLSDITDEDSGTLNIIIDNYEGIVDNATDAIEKEEARLTRLEARLRERYASLESTLSTYQSMLDTLDTYLESLSS
jgi:flagellar hook-associated protein 2